MGSSESDNIRGIFVHRIKFHHVVMVRLGLSFEHGLWGYDPDTKLVLAYGSDQHFPGLHFGWHRRQAGAAHWPIRAIGRIIRSWIGFIHRYGLIVLRLAQIDLKIITYFELLDPPQQLHWFRLAYIAFLGVDLHRCRRFVCIWSCGWSCSISLYHTLKSTILVCFIYLGATILGCG